MLAFRRRLLLQGAAVLLGALTPAGIYLGSEPSGLAIDFAQNSALVRDTVSPTEHILNGNFATNDFTSWTNNSTGTGTAVATTGAAVLVGTDGSNRGQIAQGYTTIVGRPYRMRWAGVLNSGGISVSKSDAAASGVNATAAVLLAGVLDFVATATTTYFRAVTDSGGGNGSIDSISVLPINTSFSGVPLDLLTYTTTTPKMVYGSDGVLRFARHNLILQSQTFQTTWANSASSETVDATVAPDGTLTADKLVENGSSAVHYITQSVTVSGAPHKFSVYLKAAERSIALVYCGDGFQGRNFDLANGTIGSKGAASVEASATMEDVGNGWYRCSITTSALTAGSVAFRVYMALDDTAGGATYLGDTVSGLYLWGAQLQLAPCHDNTYLPTTTAARFALPLDYNPVTLAALGVLVEEQRTNLLTRSEALDHSDWNVAASTVTANQANGPYGTATLEFLKEDGATSGHSIQAPSITTSVQTYTLSCFARAGTRTKIMLYGLNSDGKGRGFDLSNGTTFTVSGITDAVTYGIQDCGGGLYRCWITTVGAVITNRVGAIYLVSGTAFSYAGDNVSGAYVGHAQLEAGAFATSYIPTTSAQVTRAADAISLATSAFPFSATEGALASEMQIGGAFGTAKTIASLSDGTSSKEFLIYVGVTGLRTIQISDGSAQMNQNETGAVPLNTLAKQAAAWAVNDGAFSVDGETPLTDASMTLPTVDRLDIGRRGSVSLWLNGHIKRIKYIPRRVTNAELQALAA